MMRTCDKNLRPIETGDVLKVFHFIGARRKRHYMYKQVMGTMPLGGWGDAPETTYFRVSHLDLDYKHYYYLGLDEGQLTDYEIVQSTDAAFEQRDKVQPPPAEVGD